MKKRDPVGGRSCGGEKALRFVWKKVSATHLADAWEERLSWLGQHLVLIERPGSRALRIEGHQLRRADAERLVREFGGTVRVSKPMTAREIEPEARAPLRVRGRLLVVSSEKERAAATKGHPGVPVLLVPAGMAFGTGEHATTATCLRLLADVAAALREGIWDALDLGTGTGILALAARRLGAREVEAGDFDATAIRVARENAAANAIRGIVFRRAARHFNTSARRWRVVMANLFSTILVEAAPRIAAAIEKGGWLILSGILNAQGGEVIAAFEREGCRFERVVRKGKWTTCLARR
ncbi:MAG: 50S ribosomal protein L11 methyltransferase [Chthoniobacteraceae bacterium]